MTLYRSGSNPELIEILIGAAENGEGMEDVEGFQGCDVIAMATHGRSGLARWAMGSITERVLGATRVPLLVVRPPNMIPKKDLVTENNPVAA